MCLSSFDFALKYVDDLGYIGYGWKNGLTVPEVEKWYEANGSRYQTVKESTDDNFKINTILADSCKTYPAGFHIFLNKKDAEAYSNKPVYQVAFSDVLSFGKNVTGDNGKKAPCIIAKHIFYFPLKSDDYKKDPYFNRYQPTCSCGSCENFRNQYGLVKQ